MDPNKHHNALNKDDMLLWYEIKSILGQGGFGITYLAKDTNLDQLVAIKEYLPTEFSIRDAASTVQPISEKHSEIFDWGKLRFMDEAKTLAQFKHSNIVRVQSFFESNNTGYMVMEYEEGTDFSVLIKAGETFDESRLLKIVIPILEGLEVVHKNGFIHRDIKPQNIFIRKDGSPVLIDFGSARQAIGGQTRTLTSLVTPGYAPFEQYHEAEGKQGPWTDIYSLGATLYCAIAGKPPVESLKRGMARLEHNTDAYLSLSELKAGKYSEQFLKAIDHALQFREKDRPASAGEWKRMLLGEIASAEAETLLHSSSANAVDEIMASTETGEQSTEKLSDASFDTEIIDEKTVDLSLTQKQKSETGSGRERSHRWKVGIIFGAVVSIAILTLVLMVGRDQPVNIVSEIEKTESKQSTVSLLKDDSDTQSDESEKTVPDRQADIENQEIEKARKAETKRLQEQLEQEKLEAEKNKLAAEKKQQEALAQQEALLRKQKEAEQNAELAQQAALKKEKDRLKKLAEQAAFKKKQEQKKIAQQKAEKAALLNLQQQSDSQPNSGFSGRYISELNTDGHSSINLKSIFGGKPEFDTKLKENNKKITGTFTGKKVKGEIEGVREGDVIKFDWYMTGGTFGSTDGKGQWTIGDSPRIIKGKWRSRHYNVSGEWNLTRQPDS